MSEHFNPHAFPLTGRRLIEASAGTGKTYNIANIVLRLLLGDGFDALKIDEILVVTFTRAATNELQGRIRAKIEKALHAFREPDAYLQEKGRDAFISELLEKYRGDAAQLSTLARRLNDALICMDEASILTIHSFAVRAIQTFLFETGALSEVTLSESGDERREKIINDTWRSLQMETGFDYGKYLEAARLDNKNTFTGWMASIPLDSKILPAFEFDPDKALHDYLAEIDGLAAEQIDAVLSQRRSLVERWQSVFAGMDEKAIKDALRIIDVELPDGGSKRTSSTDLYKNLVKWMASNKPDLPVPEKGVIAEKISVFQQQAHEDETSRLLGDWISHAQNGFDAKDYCGRHFCALLAHWMQWQLARVDLSNLQLDDVIYLINQRLAANNADSERLRRAITGAWPVCLVDEFQDTDPAQFVMFNRFYQSVDNSGFFMIGDPKQSIYAFRGADIFSYLSVRQEIQQEQHQDNRQIFSLHTNFRSKRPLVDACNALFVEQPEKPTFVYRGIDYLPVNSCENEEFKMDKGELQSDHPSVSSKAIVFVGNPYTDNELVADKKDRLLSFYAHDTAERITLLLRHGRIMKNGQRKALRGGDIAVLVSNRHQAAIMRHALMNMSPPVASVFQSQRDSVFTQSEIAADIYLVLQAVNEPENKMRLKAALATPLCRGYKVDFSLLDEVDSRDEIHERLIDEFAEYRRQWQRHGVLTALNTLFRRRGLAKAFASHEQGDRLLTDFRHLGDLLQQQSHHCGSAEQLIDWYGQQLLDDSSVDEESKRIRLESDENLVKIVTIHVSKGLEYPVVFLPFFFLPKIFQQGRVLPLVHNPDRQYRSEINFEQDRAQVIEWKQREQMAEDMRLLYVALTRAVYQCCIGITAAVYGVQKMTLFDRSVWQHLLNLENPMPSWPEIQQALQEKLAGCEDAVDYRLLHDSQAGQEKQEPLAEKPDKPPLEIPVMTELEHSPWMISSYSRLVNAGQYVRTQGKDDETVAADEESDQQLELQYLWQDDIRFRLKGSANTGDCLHNILEAAALDPVRFMAAGDKKPAEAFCQLVEQQLVRFGLYHPDDEENTAVAVAGWLQSVLDAPLMADNKHIDSLSRLFAMRQALPEMTFDFALGHRGAALIERDINPLLKKAGAGAISQAGKAELQGLMNGAIDLVFVHDNKVYVADYKSNTLGRDPASYQHKAMDEAMQSHHYDLQYLIYTIAAHRYCRSRFANDYHYDNGAKLSFGGVFYLFLRGIGIEGEAENNGIWFKRPDSGLIEALDKALSGGGV